MLQIKNLTLTHKKDLCTILENFSCVLNDGDKAVIIGEEGNGKSTLLKWIYHPEMIEEYCEWEGVLAAPGLRMGYLPQELPEADGERTLYEYFTQMEAFFDRAPGEIASLAKELRLPVDFCYRDQVMRTLSGGEKVKAQMMRLLLEEPNVLLLDEPSNDIDIETLEWLEKRNRD